MHRVKSENGLHDDQQVAVSINALLVHVNFVNLAENNFTKDLNIFWFHQLKPDTVDLENYHISLW